MSRQLFILAFLLVKSFSLSVMAQAIQCPSSITEKPSVEHDYLNWNVVTKSDERHLEGIGIYLRYDDQYSSQVPYTDEQKKNKQIVSWRIEHTPEFTYWVGCSYIDTSAILYQQINKNAKTCTVTYELTKYGKKLSVEDIKCY